MALNVFWTMANHILKTNCFVLLVFATTTVSLAQDRAANSDDVATIDGLINAYYESVSGHPGKRDGERMLSLFVEGGKIRIDLTGGKPTHELAEEYLRTERFLTISEDFFEREIARDTQKFRDMANVISTYGISDAVENTNYTARGVTVFQLVRHTGRWWIVSTMYQRESEEFPLPAELLD
ncbi:MAG: hypothetical protein DRQ63_13295 [Gammaproteobacteria bacterium]|nr:MAG: hypothetical protein DRQ63_13295 [Gammaproteobacteria bacterium]